MKISSNKFIGIILVLFLLLIFQTTVFAQEENNSPRVMLCNSIDNIGERIRDRNSDRETKIDEVRTNRLTKQSDKRINKDKRLASYRELWDENRSDHYAKLEERAITDEQKSAVLDFQEAVENAVSDRKNAIDDAINNYRIAVDAQVEEKLENNNVAIDLFNAAISNAIEKAKNDCISGTQIEIVRQQFKDSLQIARNNLKVSIDANQLKDIIQELNEIKKEEIALAVSDFKYALEEAKVELKLAFNE